MIQAMIQAAQLETYQMPIIAEDSFRFPDKVMLEEMQGILPRLAASIGMDVDTDSVVLLIKDMFKLIAIEFSPQGPNGTETLLKVKASDVSKRVLTKNLKKLSPMVVTKVKAMGLSGNSLENTAKADKVVKEEAEWDSAEL